jgi:hypothetical protein
MCSPPGRRGTFFVLAAAAAPGMVRVIAAAGHGSPVTA